MLIMSSSVLVVLFSVVVFCVVVSLILGHCSRCFSRVYYTADRQRRTRIAMPARGSKRGGNDTPTKQQQAKKKHRVSDYGKSSAKMASKAATKTKAAAPEAKVAEAKEEVGELSDDEVVESYGELMKTVFLTFHTEELGRTDFLLQLPRSQLELGHADDNDGMMMRTQCRYLHAHS
jgi:hypothetical protein